MSARTKLNGIAFAAVLLFAAFLGGATSSWLIFVLVVVVGTVLMIHTGDVRIKASDGKLAPQDMRRKWKNR